MKGHAGSILRVNLSTKRITELRTNTYEQWIGGHGIGTEMWEDPKVPNFVSEELLKDDIVLREGMVLAVEPMVNAGSSKVRTLKDGWVVATKDKKCSAHFEHTIAIVKDGCEVMTER